MTKTLGRYVKKNFVPLAIASMVFIIYFIPYLGNTHVGVDTIYMMNGLNSVHNWLLIGRQGEAFIHYLFFGEKFSIFYAEGMSLLLYLFVLVAFGILFDRIGKVPAWKSCCFFLLVMVHPIWAEQFYFTMQLFEIAMGMLLTAVAITLAYSAERICQCISVLVMVLLFCIYQTYVVLYISGCICVFLLMYIRNASENIDVAKNYYWRLAFRQATLFLIAVIINSIISNLFFMNDAENHYIDERVLWGKAPFKECLQNITEHIRMAVTGEGIFYSLSFLLSAIILIWCLVRFLFTCRSASKSGICILSVIALQFTPFLMTIYMGSAPAFRAQFILPFTTACNFLLILMLLPVGFQGIAKSIAFRGVAATIICILLSQYYTASQLQYTADLAREDDERRAFAIEQAIRKETGGADKQIVFIGNWPARINRVTVNGEETNRSMFQFCIWGQPRYLDMNFMATEYMKTLGISAARVWDANRIAEARSIAQEMPSWPLDGSIREMDDYVVIKVAPDDYYAEECMVPQIQKCVSAETITFSNDRCNALIEHISNENDVLSIQGWMICLQNDSSYVVPQVCLLDEANNLLYPLSTGTQYRPDLTENFFDSTNYSHGGFLAKAPLSELPEDYSRFRIILSAAVADKTLYFDTDSYVLNWLG